VANIVLSAVLFIISLIFPVPFVVLFLRDDHFLFKFFIHRIILALGFLNTLLFQFLKKNKILVYQFLPFIRFIFLCGLWGLSNVAISHNLSKTFGIPSINAVNVFAPNGMRVLSISITAIN